MRTGAQADNPGLLEAPTDGRVQSPGSISLLCMLPCSPGSWGEGTIGHLEDRVPFGQG